MLCELITEDFVNEERFAKSYTRGKFRFNKWGRLKIQQALQHRGLSSYCQKVGLKEIDPTEYHDQITELLTKKLDTSKGEDLWVTKNKAARHLISKGYESELVWNILNEIIS